jgi:hypothetical protein
MPMGTRTQKTFLKYRAEDFPLYLFSLVAAGALILPAIGNVAGRVLVVASLLYMAAIFIARHGVRFNVEALRVLAEGVAGYPARVARNWWSVRQRVLQAVLLFALALTAERLLRSSLQGTFWVRPFPWQWVVWVPFLAITVFRVMTTVAHLLRAKHVRDFLLDSPVKSVVDGAPIQLHIVHAFCTGLLSHLCLVAPLVLFYMYTDPTWLRETLLLAGYAAWCVFSWKTGTYTPVEQGGDGVWFLRGGYGRLFSENHALDHRDRFYFTVFHGHHHDTIPAAMIGAASGTGLLENADRDITWLEFLDSAILVQLSWTALCVSDMFAHQYVPGVFPFSKFNLTSRNHHVAHHFGSLYPLGLYNLTTVSRLDVQGGYETDNARVRWYLDQVARFEGLTEEHRRKFVSPCFAAHARVRVSELPDEGDVDLQTAMRDLQEGLDTAIHDTPAGDARLKILEAAWMRAVMLRQKNPASSECVAWEGVTLWHYARELNDVTSMTLVREACGKLMSALKMNPRVLQGAAHLTLGRALARAPGVANRRKALACVQKAVSLDPDGIEPRVVLAELLLRDPNTRDEAREVLELALAAPTQGRRRIAERALKQRATELLAPFAPSADVSGTTRPLELA